MIPDWYRALLRPGGVAIIGAADDGRKASGRPQRYLAKYGYEGPVYPVNPSRPTVQGVPSVPSLLDIDGPVDVAVVVTAAHRSLDAVQACVARQVPAVIMIPSGFAELDAEGARLQDELAGLVRGSGTRVLGPNCVGVVSARSKFVATIASGMDQDGWDLRDGGVGFLTQSGAMGGFVVNMTQRRRLGLGSMISTGNEMDISFSEMLMAMVEDTEIRGVLGYIEGIRDGAAFIAALQRAQELGKPLGFLKGGRSGEGRDAVASHTGALAGVDTVYRGLFEQYGVSRLDTIEDLADWAQMIDLMERPSGRRLSIATQSGGAGILTADYCADLGLDLAHWEGPWQHRLRELMPSFLSPRNPIDLSTAASDPAALAAIVDLMNEHPATDVRLVILGNLERQEDVLVDTLAKAAASHPTPLIVTWVGGSGQPVVELSRRGVPAYTDPHRAVAALAHLYDRKPPSGQAGPARPAPSASEEARRLLSAVRASDRLLLDEHESKRLLAAYGLTPVEERPADSPAAAGQAAAQLGFPVAVKVLSAHITHKSDAGGVSLNLASVPAVEEAARRLLERRGTDLPADTRVLVQRMAPPGREILLGAHRDTTFGPVLAIGMGGTLAELLDDIAIRVPPVPPDEIRAALQKLRAAKLLAGFRDQPAPDIDTLIHAVAGLSTLLADIGDDIAEIDINPLIVGPLGAGALVADALVVLRAQQSNQ